MKKKEDALHMKSEIASLVRRRTGINWEGAIHEMMDIWEKF